MGRFLKKLTEGNARNSRFINYVDVTKIRKTRVVRRAGSREQNTHPSHHARMRILNKATENMWFLWKVRKPLVWSRLLVSLRWYLASWKRRDNGFNFIHLKLDAETPCRKRLARLINSATIAAFRSKLETIDWSVIITLTLPMTPMTLSLVFLFQHIISHFHLTCIPWIRAFF